ncbi:MAG: DUF1684 domain-containing protein [Deinococcota bacterium]
MTKDIFQLTDYRRQVAALYAKIRADDNPERAHATFIQTRNTLFAEHSQSPLDATQKQSFAGLQGFAYDPAYRFVVQPHGDVEDEVFDIKLRDDGIIQIRRVARVELPLPQGTAYLSLFWVEGYGGGLFLPFRDSTNSTQTYGGGRYLLDTIKHADLGMVEDGLVLDFNFAYNPSCAYNSAWDCPLAPFENRLEQPIFAGEFAFTG